MKKGYSSVGLKTRNADLKVTQAHPDKEMNKNFSLASLASSIQQETPAYNTNTGEKSILKQPSDLEGIYQVSLNAS